MVAAQPRLESLMMLNTAKSFNISLLPQELVLIIVDHLLPEDKKSFSLVSRAARSLALSGIFEQVKYTCYDPVPQLERVRRAGQEVKNAIRKIKIQSGRPWFQQQDNNNVIFELLATLANLRSLAYTQFGQLVPISQLRELLLSVRSPCLEEFFLNDTSSGLKSTMDSYNAILSIVAETCPGLTTLSVTVRTGSVNRLFFWQDSHIHSLAKLSNLTDLSLSSDFENGANDPVPSQDYKESMPWFVRCYTRRLEATQAIAKKCRRLERCSWIQLGVPFRKGIHWQGPRRIYPSDKQCLVHRFIVAERQTPSGMARMVEGIEQWWMKDYEKIKIDDSSGKVVLID